MRQVRIVALGDSTTAGTPGWQSPLEAPPYGAGDETSQYAYWLMKAHPEWEVLNRGVNGERSDQIADRVERDVIASAPAVVVIIAGVNDVYQGRDVDHVVQQLERMYERAKRSSVRVVAGSILPYDTATALQNDAMRRVNRWIEEYPGRDPNVRFVDTRAAVSAPERPDLLRESPDGLHPSPAAYHSMADAIARALETVIG